MSSLSPRRSTESFESPLSPRSAQFPFPQHDWTQRPNSTGRFKPRRGSTASSIHSVGGTLDTASSNRMGPVTETGQNAISTLLQPPIVRTGMLPHTSAAGHSHKPPSTRDIPPVTLTNIPHVDASSFKPYLSQIGSLYDAFQRAKAEGDRGRKDKDGPNDDFAEMLERGLRREATRSPSAQRHGSIASPSPASSPQPKRRSSGSIPKRGVHAVTPLSTIPNVYFDENFHLENPRTFDIVSERSEVVRPPPGEAGSNGSLEPTPTGRKALATNAILQEKLSWYMDTVEVHLISSISNASTSFFEALGSLRDLQSESEASVAKIKQLREELSQLDQQMAVGGLKVIEMKQRRENLRRLIDATEQLNCVTRAITQCEELIDNGELDTAMNRMNAVDDLISGTLDLTNPENTEWLPKSLPKDIMDIRSLKALEGLSDGMQQLGFRVGKGFEARFLETLLTDLRQHIKSVPPKDTVQRWTSSLQRTRGDQNRMQSINYSYQQISGKLRADLQACLNGLAGSGYTGPAAAAFKESIMREMKSLIRQSLPASNDDDAESVTSTSTKNSRALSQADKSSILARNLRALDLESAEELLVSIYSNVGEALRRLSIQLKVLLDVTSGVGSPPASSGGLRSPPRSPNIGNIDDYMSRPLDPADANHQLQLQELMQVIDMSSLLGQAVDAAQNQITKVLKVRSDQTTRLPLHPFLRYFNLTRMFADECEAVSGRSGAALKGAVNNQIHDFIPRWGDMEKQQLVQLMETDRWDAKDFNDDDTDLLSGIIQGMTNDPVKWFRSGLPFGDADPAENANGVTKAPEGNGTSKEKTRNAIIEEEKFIVTESSIAVLRGIDRFENLVSSIPSMTSEVASTLIEYLKLFNSRLCQLILGAGALRSAGLKNINTKHLALASQALSFMTTLIPYIREFIRRHLSAAQTVLGEFDKVKRLFQDHQASIHDKLVDIMSGRATAHVNSMKKVNFDTSADQNVSPHMETLTKETSTLHRVLSKHLPEISVRMIMGPVFASYKEQWGKAFTEANVKSPAGKARLLRDAELFDAKLSKIDGSADIGEHITSIVKAKTVEVEKAPPSPQPPQQEEEKPTGVNGKPISPANGATEKSDIKEKEGEKVSS